MLKGTLQQMAEWIHSYIANQDGNEYINGDIRVHSVFYSVCQGLFYVIAFRQNDLVSTRKSMLYNSKFVVFFTEVFVLFL